MCSAYMFSVCVWVHWGRVHMWMVVVPVVDINKSTPSHNTHWQMCVSCDDSRSRYMCVSIRKCWLHVRLDVCIWSCRIDCASCPHVETSLSHYWHALTQFNCCLMWTCVNPCCMLCVHVDNTVVMQCVVDTIRMSTRHIHIVKSMLYVKFGIITQCNVHCRNLR